MAPLSTFVRNLSEYLGVRASTAHIAAFVSFAKAAKQPSWMQRLIIYK